MWNYDNLHALGREGQEKGLPLLVVDKGEADRKTRDIKDNIGGIRSPKSTCDNDSHHVGKDRPVVWKPIESKLSHNRESVSAGFQDHDRREEGLLHASDETVTAKTGTVRWRRVGIPPAEVCNIRDTSGHGIRIGDRTVSWESGKGDQQVSQVSTGDTTTANEGTDTYQLLSPLSETPNEKERFEKDSYLYWRNTFKDLEYSMTRDTESRARQKNRLKKDGTPYPFDRQRVNHLYQNDLLALWDDLTGLNKTECEVWWNELSPRIRLRLWPGLMLMALRHRPSEALKLLQITYTGVQPPAYAVSESLDYLVEHYLLKTEEASYKGDIEQTHRTTIAHDLQKTVIRWLNLEYGVRVLQKTIWTLVTNLEDDQVRLFYDDLRRLQHHFYPNTLIHFASRFAKSSGSENIDLSFDILKGLHGRMDFDHPAVMSLCTTIIHRSHQAKDAKSTVAEKFQIMLDLGIKVNIIIYNILIQNAIRSGDTETAWSIHEMMLENGTEPDEFTYSMLLNDAKKRMDSASIRAVMGHIQEKGIAGPYITTDMIHLIYLLHQNSEQLSKGGDSESVQRSRRKDGFEKMLGKYCEHFSSAALRSLIPSFLQRFPQATNAVFGTLPDPPAHTLVVMLTGLLYSLDSTATKDQYDRFLYLISRKEKFAMLVASDSHIWNVFLMALGRFHDRLSDCPKVIKTMISLRDDARDRLTHHRVKEAQTPEKHLTAEPDVYTWSILVHSFTKHKQLRAAEKVITAMQSRGTSPSDVTWTTLAYGYSRTQDVEKMADTIHRMESGGEPLGDRMVAAMAGIKDREGLMRALRKRKAADLAAKADA